MFEQEYPVGTRVRVEFTGTVTGSAASSFKRLMTHEVRGDDGCTHYVFLGERNATVIEPEPEFRFGDIWTVDGREYIVVADAEGGMLIIGVDDIGMFSPNAFKVKRPALVRRRDT